MERKTREEPARAIHEDVSTPAENEPRINNQLLVSRIGNLLLLVFLVPLAHFGAGSEFLLELSSKFEFFSLYIFPSEKKVRTHQTCDIHSANANENASKLSRGFDSIW
jgi:hypothetical protein